jgi:uncharacterized protein (TIGR03000 family)
MHRTVLLTALAIVGLALSTSDGWSQKGVKTEEPARLTVFVPADAKITIDGQKTTSIGEVRRYVSPPLTQGQGYTYTIKAVWKNNGKDVVREREARVRAGQETVLDLRKEEVKKNGQAPLAKLQATDRTGGVEAGLAPQQDDQERGKEIDKEEIVGDVVFWPTPQNVVDKMLELAEVKKGDLVYDLGCGDGRIVVTAAKKYGAKGVGVDINPKRIKESKENAKKSKVEDLVTFKQADIFKDKIGLSDATVVTLYLLPELNVRLMPQLEKMKPGTRIVSHDFDMRGAKPKKKVEVKAKNHRGEEGTHTIYLWVVPWEKE